MSDMPHPMPGQPIPTPPNFPVHWAKPEDAHLFWQQDKMHFPDALTPLEADSFGRIVQQGFQFAITAYDMPIKFLVRPINAYFYQAVGPLLLPPAEMQTMAKRNEEKMGAALARLGELWATEWLPEIKTAIAAWEHYDLRGATIPQLLTHFDETIARSQRMWQVHFLIAFPMLASMSGFDDLYRDLFRSDGAFDAFRLLQGFDNMAVATDRALWPLSRKASASPTVRKVFEEGAAADVVPALEMSAEGQAFLADLRAYLNEYGQRRDKWMSLSQPSWIEDPTPVIKNLKDYITQPDRDFDAERKTHAAERDQAVAAAREKLKGYPQPVVGQFEFMLKAAQTGTALSEDHAYWIDFRSMYQVRRVLVEAGRRLAAAGVIDRADDVFFLTFDEARETLAATSPMNRKSLVAERKAEFARWKAIQPPPVIGTMPPGPPPDDPGTRSLIKFFGGPPQMPTEPNSLKGNAGSPGVVRGPAKVIRSLSEAGKLQKGDILVAETTAPPWTPLFATAAGIVTDTGGVLSHCAVVAREYHIPAVVGTTMGTAIVKDGMMLEVDGNKGVVRIIG